jgi:protease I
MSKRIAILATHGFEESELKSPKEHLEAQGWETEIISLAPGKIKSWVGKDWGPEYDVDNTIDKVSSSQYNALLLPGGVINPDLLRVEPHVLDFIKDFFAEGKPVAAICHGPQSLISAEVVQGRKMTSVKSIKHDLMNAGANWVDEEVVVDKGLVTSRTPKDLPAFNEKMVEEIKEGHHKLHEE